MVNYVGEFRGKAQAIYHLEDVNDGSGNGFNLTNRGTCTFAAGKFANAVILGNANTTKYLDIANNLTLDTYKAGIFTISSLVYLQTAPTSGNYETFWGIENNTKAQVIMKYNNAGGTLQLYYEIYTGGVETLTWNVTLALNTWIYIVIVKNGTTLTAYLDGVSLGNKTITIADASPARSNQFTIGTDVFSAAGHWKGNIDETAVFLYAKTAAEVRKDYAWATGRLL